MNNDWKLFDYALDLVYGATKYPCGWIKPKVYLGYFNRTPWQLVFPGQTASLIKKIEPTAEGVDEYHVRFYDDGVIHCELEVNRFNGWHWVGPRIHGVDLLEDILDNEMTHLPQNTRDAIRPLFGIKPYSDECVRRKNSVRT